MTVFKAPDLANHFFWANPALGANWRAAIDEYYERTDAEPGIRQVPLQPRRRAGAAAPSGRHGAGPRLFEPNVASRPTRIAATIPETASWR